MLKHLFKNTIFLMIVISVLTAEKRTIIKMATLAPEGTDWHGMLVEMGQRWKTATDGNIILRIYPGGVVGDERDMIRKMRIGQIHAAAITTEGLSEINPDVNVYIIPMLFDGYDDVDWFRNKIGKRLEDGIKENGFTPLLWADVGWAHWFTVKPIRYPKDLKKAKIFTWAGDYKTAELWGKGGYMSVPLASIDILSGLQTGLIDAIGVTPIAALASQWFGIANHMLEIKWGLLTSSIIIDNRVWNRIPSGYQKSILKISQEIGDRHQKIYRYDDEKAIEIMKEHGLVVHPQSVEDHLFWKSHLKTSYPDIRGTFVPEDIFDQAIELMEQRESK
jgi:TRAP-type C4-dicarboxylate transport system substrate-binding protein